MERIDETKPEFPAFPYKPYSIQFDFMKALYKFLNKGGISMLESPTGTGKTLSIICGALQWVADQRKKQNDTIQDGSDKTSTNESQFNSDDEPDWMRTFAVSQDHQNQEKKIKKKEFGVGSGRHKKEGSKYNHQNLFSQEEDHFVTKEQKHMQTPNDSLEMEDQEFLVEDYESDDEVALSGGQSKRKNNGVSISSSSDDEEDQEESNEEKLKVYFCSRTHSQLSQFIKELRKTVFASELNVICLGSRKIFCINEEVLKLGNASHINERCLELQKKKTTETSKAKKLGGAGKMCRTKASSGCPMLGKPKLQKNFRSQISQRGPLDIEDLVHLGRNVGTCPYYGSRSMVQAADLIVLPYQSLLSKSSRESLGLVLKNSIVIIDEAHNLADSLISMYDSMITYSQLENVHHHMERYFERFWSLLGPGNRRYIQTLILVTRALLKLLHNEEAPYAEPCKNNSTGKNSTLDYSMAINDFLFSLNIDNINFVKLLQYIKESNIMHKVSGYGERIINPRNDLGMKTSGKCYEKESTLSSFRALADMLLSFINFDGDGRMIISKNKSTCFGENGGYIKFVMLTGEKIFSEVVDQTHAVVLAGGTLQPIEETRERLFPWLPSSQLNFFSCSHIVPPESVLPMAVSSGPSGQPFDFSYSSRSSSAIVKELGLLLCNLVTVVPEGIVVFFSSFDYEEQVHGLWRATGILDRIMKKKRIFREPRNNTDVESVLKEYKENIDALSKKDPQQNISSSSGAVLLAVVGGKISEGINLSDGMGRCIVMVGLPYPSPSDIELMERVKHIETLGNSNSIKSLKFYNEVPSGDVETGLEILRSCKRGKEYYENLCMKAVNQSIGRAIRHINDYAAILLVDVRYSSNSSKRSFSHPADKLPKWIKDCLISSTENYGEVHRRLHQFFKLNRKMGQ
ncbi:ATP-dependent DNA helicase DDX11 isoform X1 [Cucurbita moschata]|uniref:ATP-dependent DNA helicase DDX11 isoform X1 n=2 Tax=Cucurbita moschata TaxID=3662 RepID=A0A6J1GSF1_CUCMO|nr:ATP-dependent DNA helicase DDX11 isoform X1 [Cucurbita moschata]XP_022954243.1 ATP-dependent DNA helicase DDX11 isoform X1 [Cucurbita moschata]XP_022954244.1 ATP-dependent DNA helicase DDX11 isoform X1 [Cucurbita moschata]